MQCLFLSQKLQCFEYALVGSDNRFKLLAGCFKTSGDEQFMSSHLLAVRHPIFQADNPNSKTSATQFGEPPFLCSNLP